MVDVHRWWFGVLPYWLYQRKMPEDATGKADVDRSACNHCIGVYMWLHCESMAWLVCMGLQQYTAKVGQVLTIKAIDKNGKPTEVR